MTTQLNDSDIVSDPVGHISISGVHGRDELNDRLANATPQTMRAGRQSSIGPLLIGAAIGAAVMYLFDPARGKRRRSLLRDQVVHARNVSADRLGKLQRDVRNRAVGAVAEARGLVTPDESDDAVITERVRAAMGRVVSHPSSIVVTATDGTVTLSGPILASEVEELVATVHDVRGVQGVLSQLEVHETAGNVPGLQDATQ